MQRLDFSTIYLIEKYALYLRSYAFFYKSKTTLFLNTYGYAYICFKNLFHTIVW